MVPTFPNKILYFITKALSVRKSATWTPNRMNTRFPSVKKGAYRSVGCHRTNILAFPSGSTRLANTWLWNLAVSPSVRVSSLSLWTIVRSLCCSPSMIPESIKSNIRAKKRRYQFWSWTDLYRKGVLFKYLRHIWLQQRKTMWLPDQGCRLNLIFFPLRLRSLVADVSVDFLALPLWLPSPLKWPFTWRSRVNWSRNRRISIRF